MRLDFSDERVLAVVAHPDDAEYFCAGTLARARSEGAVVAVDVLCQGDKGQGKGAHGDDLVEKRRREMQTAADLLGAELMSAERPDGQLRDDDRLRRVLLDHFRSFRPTLVLTHSPRDYHPDHRSAAAVAEATTWFSASAGQSSQFEVLRKQPALWWMDTMNMVDFQPGFFVDISDQLLLKQQLLACHTSQMARGCDEDFSPLVDQMTRQNQMRGAQCGVAAAEVFQMHLAWKRPTAW